MKAAEAATHGLVDAVVGEGSLRADAIAFAQKLVAEAAPLKKVRDRSEKLTADASVFAAFRKANARKFRGFEAPRPASSASRRRSPCPSMPASSSSATRSCG